MANFDDVTDIEDITENEVEESQPQEKQIHKFDNPKSLNEARSMVSSSMESEVITPETGVIRWVYDPKDTVQTFEMFLRGMYVDRFTGKVEQLYKGYYDEEEDDEETGEQKMVRQLVPYRLMNDRGINDAMGIFTIYVNRVTSFSQYDMNEIDSALSQMLFDLHERYIVHKAKEFEIRPEDAYLTVNTMYNFIRSGWLQSFRGKSLNMLGKTSRVTEVYGNQNRDKKQPKWKFW